LNHRVKNTLATIHAITADDAQCPGSTVRKNGGGAAHPLDGAGT
jgi:hypothetical protein